MAACGIQHSLVFRQPKNIPALQTSNPIGACVHPPLSDDAASRTLLANVLMDAKDPKSRAATVIEGMGIVTLLPSLLPSPPSLPSALAASTADLILVVSAATAAGDALWAPRKRSYPRTARLSATAAPMPPPAPVITAVLLLPPSDTKRERERGERERGQIGM